MQPNTIRMIIRRSRRGGLYNGWLVLDSKVASRTSHHSVADAVNALKERALTVLQKLDQQS
jgi:hypothetical protein